MMMQRRAVSSAASRTILARPVVGHAGALPLLSQQRRGYAKPGGRGGAVERPKKEYKGDQYIDEMLVAYGLQVPTWDDIPEWVWKAELLGADLKKPKELTPLDGPLFWKKINRERIKQFNEDRTWGVVKGKWKLGE
ncbi:uncharacterized protein ACA1_085200 [Acanthamoeba castellanii str. Neff]|uniref:Uncharacterized protein n=1 Tax=Acanthamoeba castellanii (strain ATCC 30010 / Neff) TaxID=1257118 RepID=L8HMS3_ACACF|nr:uncharacterized protein ACA1_085200 [Acanthamoeba castellanii str. Neff]ELR25691.1 hypothetical protein ACA1_085200 [Acanthamoeba castellanii str. Neff]